MYRATVSTSSGAQSKSGNPCDRLIAPCSLARRVITAKMLTPVAGSLDWTARVVTRGKYHKRMTRSDAPVAQHVLTPSIHQLTPDQLRSMYRTILLPRLVEE